MTQNPDNWKWIFYFNPKDPRITVPKMNPLFGWTLNLGNLYSYLIIIGFVLIILAFKYFL
ncbi:MAG TPA: hypothetical protein ENH02_01850 [Bacteroidetes bacterium]|nr:hypothetical protein [Bacteroidota bacterium]